ncbi:MAG: hypothetical protein NDI70_05835 [Pseudomonas sagittaria]|nr:hypothetical protein [Pseudomonas sagittaria]
MTFCTLSRGIVAVSFIMATTGCASIISDSKYPVSITSEPSGANYEVRNEAGRPVHAGITPDQVTLEAGAGYFDGEYYTVSYTKDGHEKATSVVDTSIDGWYWGNLLFGGLIGFFAVDPATGAMYKLPESTQGRLKQLPPSPLALSKPTEQGASQTKEQLLNELAQDKSLSYEEYQRRHSIITRMP